MNNTIVVIFNNKRYGKCEDLEIPLSITANELIQALDQAYGFADKEGKNGLRYLKCENPIALLKGNKQLTEYGLRDGSVITAEY